MASILCKCGNRLSNSESPNHVILHVYTDYEWDDILRMDYVEMINFPKSKNDVWKCVNCNRIYVFDKLGNVIKIYRLEQ